jgi:hypothetical protein
MHLLLLLLLPCRSRRCRNGHCIWLANSSFLQLRLWLHCGRLWPCRAGCGQGSTRCIERRSASKRLLLPPVLLLLLLRVRCGSLHGHWGRQAGQAWHSCPAARRVKLLLR